MGEIITKSLKCPQCGAMMEIIEDEQKIVCPHCGYTEVYEIEPSAEERAEDLQKMSYGYTSGRLQAEEDFKNAQRKKTRRRKALIWAAVIAFAVLSCVIGYREELAKELAKPKIDPFDYVDVTFTGREGSPHVNIEKHGTADEGISLSNIRYSCETDTDGLRNGDTVTVKAECTEYRLTQDSRDYTVEGLDRCLRSAEDIDADVLSAIRTATQEYMERDLVYDTNMLSSAVLHVEGYEAEPAAVYAACDGERLKNYVIDIWKLHMHRGEYEADRYYAVVYRDVYLLNDGPFTIVWSSQLDRGNTVNAIGQLGEGGGVWGSYSGILTGFYTLKDAEAWVYAEDDFAGLKITKAE